MNALDLVEQLKRRARRRRARSIVGLSLPMLVASCALAWRLGGLAGLALMLVAGVALLGWLIVHFLRRLDEAWVAQQLDRHRADLEDSSSLLLLDPDQLSGLQRLQRHRLERRLHGRIPEDLRNWRPTYGLLVSWVLGAAITAAALLISHEGSKSAPAAGPGNITRRPAAVGPRLVEQHLEISPPAYTGLPPRSEDTLDARVPAGSTLHWRLRFEPVPPSAELVFHDQLRIPLVLADGVWTAQRMIERSALYRVTFKAADAAAAQPLHQLDVVADQPPAIRVIAPGQSVTLLQAGQRQWPLAFEASDDYGLGPARLEVTLAKGGGEQVSITERTIRLNGRGDARLRRYDYRLDLPSLKLLAGDDVIVHLSVGDNRSPTPNSSRSAGLILRWPAADGDASTGLEGIVQRTMPAFFRSQRQVIIDSEALIAQRGRMQAERFTSQSDLIGVDQRLLRMRYGQFMGQETEEAGAHDEHERQDAPPRPGASEVDDILHDFGHVHDLPEAATLLDRDTRALLKQALDQMWQAELQLRQGQPELALPYEYRALDRIKQVQQASRIYLARVGLELPPIDSARRLTGDASGVRGRPDPLTAGSSSDSPAAALWAVLAKATPSGGNDDPQLLAALDELAQWVHGRQARIPDAINLLTAIDALRQDPRCGDCRKQLEAAVWPLLPVPPAAVSSREHDSVQGDAYLDALSQGSDP
jgi:hypothetical protein